MLPDRLACGGGGLLASPAPSTPQPSVFEAPTPSLASTRFAVTSNCCGPKPAGTKRSGPESIGDSWRTSPMISPSNRYCCIVGEEPSEGVAMLALLRPEASCPWARIGSPSAPPRP